MPLHTYAGSWVIDKNHPSRSHLESLKRYLLSRSRSGDLVGIDFDEMERLSSKGLAFKSSIPEGYGLGSSGAVSAAIYDLFMNPKELVDLTKLKKDLSIIESCFHGSSSGIDPIVSYLNQPVLIHNKEKIELLDAVNQRINEHIYLIDTGIKRSTAPLVEAYLETRRSSEQFIMEMQDISLINDELIAAYLMDDLSAFNNLMMDLSRCQYKTMKMMIPEAYHRQWQEGLDSGQYAMKINGAGAGGFLMIYRIDGSVYNEANTVRIS